MHSHNSPTTKPLYRGTQSVWYILGAIETILLIRFILKLFAANPNAGFSNFIYDLSYVFVAPFLNVFQITTFDGSIFEWTTLLAMFIYYLIARGILKLLFMSRSVSTSEAASRLDEV